MNNGDFDADTGVFSCKEEGVYSFALSSLMKSQENNLVKLKMMIEDREGRVSRRLCNNTKCLILEIPVFNREKRF